MLLLSFFNYCTNTFSNVLTEQRDGVVDGTKNERITLNNYTKQKPGCVKDTEQEQSMKMSKTFGCEAQDTMRDLEDVSVKDEEIGVNPQNASSYKYKADSTSAMQENPVSIDAGNMYDVVKESNDTAKEESTSPTHHNLSKINKVDQKLCIGLITLDNCSDPEGLIKIQLFNLNARFCLSLQAISESQGKEIVKVIMERIAELCDERNYDLNDLLILTVSQKLYLVQDNTFEFYVLHQIYDFSKNKVCDETDSSNIDLDDYKLIYMMLDNAFLGSMVANYKRFLTDMRQDIIFGLFGKTFHDCCSRVEEKYPTLCKALYGNSLFVRFPDIKQPLIGLYDKNISLIW